MTTIKAGAYDVLGGYRSSTNQMLLRPSATRTIVVGDSITADWLIDDPTVAGHIANKPSEFPTRWGLISNRPTVFADWGAAPNTLYSILNKPTTLSQFTNDLPRIDWNVTGTYGEILNKPTALSQLTNDLAQVDWLQADATAPKHPIIS